MAEFNKGVIKQVIENTYKPRKFQYTNEGVHRAVFRAKALLVQGYHCIAHLDVPDFYGSFTTEKLLKELPLPKGAVTNVVCGRHHEVVWKSGCLKGGLSLSFSPYTQESLYTQARQGMPQGSACSSIVGAHMVSRLHWQSTAGVDLVNYVDDFLLLAKSPQALAKAVDELSAAVEDLPGGNFGLKLKEKRLASQGFEFLGHVFQYRKGELRVSPTAPALESLYGELVKLNDKMQAIVFKPSKVNAGIDKKAAIIVMARSEAVVQGWCAAFKRCDVVGDIEKQHFEMKKQWLAEIGASHANVLKALTPDMKYEVDLYALGK